MNNYYEGSLAEIKQAITDNNPTKALEMLDEELRMPYIPEPYQTAFESLRDSLRTDTKQNSMYFEFMEDIEEALKGSDALKYKALISLERLNLRVHIDSIRSILVNDLIDDWMKRQILIFMIEQSINEQFDIRILGQSFQINVSTLVNPLETESFKDAYTWLHETLESEDPSLLMLCIAELEQVTLENFPIVIEEISGPAILSRVKGYLSAV